MNLAPSSPPPRSLDRLSLLPNELLDAIFDLSYLSFSYLFPLSKRLRPFQERQLYRSITLSSVDQFLALSRTIDLAPARGELVTGILIWSQARPRKDPARVPLDDLLSKIPNLVTLQFPVGSSQYEAPSAAVMSRLSGVKTVIAFIINGRPAHDSSFKCSDLAFLSALPSLLELNVYNWPSFNTSRQPSPGGMSFERVETLKVEGDGADEETVLQIVDLCPKLRRLDLLTTALRETQYSTLLPILPVTLRSLGLSSFYGYTMTIDAFLPRFTQLRHLVLGNGFHSRDIHDALGRLPQLVTVRLADGAVRPTINYQGLASFVSGPARPVNFKCIFLDSLAAQASLLNERTSAPSNPSFSAGASLSDWYHPSNYLRDPVELRLLVGACESNGVDLSGTMLDCLETLEDFHIEANNRAVLAAAYHGDRDFHQLYHTRTEASQAGVTLPSFDLDSLDPDHLEVVETELPEKEWFVLSLRSKARSEDM